MCNDPYKAYLPFKPEAIVIEGSNEYSGIGRRIKRRRIELGLTQDELGQHMGIKKSAVCRLESEESSFSIERVMRAAKAFDTTPEYLAGWADTCCNLRFESSYDDRISQLISYYSELDEVGKDKLLTYAKGMYVLEKAEKARLNCKG